MASSSCPNQSSVSMNANSHPTPLASYEDVVASQKLFMATLEKLPSVMGTKFKIPIIGGRELDLHKLFVEVTSRGGIEKIIRERRWKEVTTTFSFPPTATNASFVLRKYYYLLLYHYEQIYDFKAHGQIPQNPSGLPITAQGTIRPSQEIQAITFKQPKTDSTESPAAAGSRVIGVIDGEFDNGYLVTIVIGSETLKGVLYQMPQNAMAGRQVSQNYAVTPNSRNGIFQTPSGKKRRRRRKRSEIKRLDLAHPKPNQSGYNFFFKEQQARLNQLHPGKDREISRIIGELWNKLNELEKAVYQEKALGDKERYRIEMQDYREKLRTGQLISHAVPQQQRLPQQNAETPDADATMEDGGEGDGLSGTSNESDPEMIQGATGHPGTETLAEPAVSEPVKEKEVTRNEKTENLTSGLSGANKESTTGEQT